MTPTTTASTARCCIKKQGHINNIDEDINMQTPATPAATIDQLPLHDYSAAASSPSAASDSSTLIDSLDTGLVSTSASDSASSSHATGISKTIATTTMVSDISDGLVKCVQGLLDGVRDDNDDAITTVATCSITSTVRKVSFNEVTIFHPFILCFCLTPLVRAIILIHQLLFLNSRTIIFITGRNRWLYSHPIQL